MGGTWGIRHVLKMIISNNNISMSRPIVTVDPERPVSGGERVLKTTQTIFFGALGNSIEPPPGTTKPALSSIKVLIQPFKQTGVYF